MSIRVMTQIWDTCLYQSGTLNVLLAMADHASDNGRDIYPGMEYLAAKCRQTARATQDCVKRLRADRVVILLGTDGEDLEPIVNPIGGRGHRTEYRIDLERVQKLQALHQADEPNCKHCEAGRKTLQKDAQKGELARRKGEKSRLHIENHQESSINPLSSARPAARESGEILSLEKGSPGRFQEFVDAVANTWPGGFPKDNLTACSKAWDRETRIHAADLLIECARLHGLEKSKLAETRTPQQGKLLMAPPSRFLQNGTWKGYVQAHAEQRDAESKMVTALGNVRRSLGTELFKLFRERWGYSDAAMACMDGVEFIAGDPAQFLVKSYSARVMVEKKQFDLQRALGCEVVVRHVPAVKAG